MLVDTSEIVAVKIQSQSSQATMWPRKIHHFLSIKPKEVKTLKALPGATGPAQSPLDLPMSPHFSAVLGTKSLPK